MTAKEIDNKKEMEKIDESSNSKYVNPKNIIDDDIFEQRLMAIMLKTKQPGIATDNGWPLLDQ